MSEDERLIRRTYELAREGDFPFGALIAVDGKVVRTSTNTVESERDVTAHPELKLARWGARELPAEDRADATLHSSTEPCPMCSGALYWSGIPRVVYGVRAENAGGNDLIPKMACETVFESGSLEVEAVGPVLEAEGRKIHREFWEDGGPDLSFTGDLYG